EFYVKDDGAHDPLVDAGWIAGNGVASPDDVAAMTRIGREAFATLERAWAAQGVSLVDLKIEFGRDADGRLLVADVIDNDSWRLWPGGRKEAMLDKQRYRDLREVTGEALADVLAHYRQVADMTDEFATTPTTA